ncbi:dithiol-disulfide isomerase involved in polyketide biosynthesis [Janibacter hoylei PVAS-1]|uniref:Dithiol-disulfide isomerase involved in polyketide biosynthesis n=2 Tax=Janibacter hoylei PVAS-1 TaxID=1210046 RepID=K1E059_9MICO|nr:dithiol-disulfide isomerase involved in polyketide biosynthesis [Janibacter hoylei PVAS-1]
MPPDMQIDIWSDIACPWCYIGKRRLETALTDHPQRDEITVAWHSYQLDPSLPEHYDGTEAEYLASRKGMPVEQVRQMFGHVAEQAAGEGLAYDFDRLVVANSARAHQLLHLAKERGVADAVKEGLLSGHFEHGLDIGDVDALVRVGVAAGLDEGEVRASLEDGRYEAAVAADIDMARQIGVTGVPFVVIDMKYAVSGAQPPEVFREVVDKALAERTPAVQVVQSGDVCGPDGC